jgi:hypothetical protein
MSNLAAKRGRKDDDHLPSMPSSSQALCPAKTKCLPSCHPAAVRYGALVQKRSCDPSSHEISSDASGKRKGDPGRKEWQTIAALLMSWDAGHPPIPVPGVWSIRVSAI